MMLAPQCYYADDDNLCIGGIIVCVVIVRDELQTRCYRQRITTSHS